MKSVLNLIGGLFIVAALLIASPVAFGGDSDWDIGLRYSVLVGQGEPSNDMGGIGLYSTFNWKEDWYFGLGVNQYEFDYENPAKIMGLSPASVVDGKNDMTQVSAWLERRYGAGDGKWSWFWNAGLGYGFVTADTVAGETTSGDPFLITTDASDEFQLLTSIGLHYDFATNWRIELAALAQYHFTDYKLTDKVSGSTGSIGAHVPIGVNFGISYRF